MMLRKTKILCTLGPATHSPEVLEEMIRAGADIFRLNMSHASHEAVTEVVKNVRQVSAKVGRDVGVLMDLRGPSIRTGDLEEPIHLKVGDSLELIAEDDVKPRKGVASVGVNYPGLPNDLGVGDTLLIDGGVITATVTESGGGTVLSEVTIGGDLTSRRHINLPGVNVKLPALTQKDIADIDFATSELEGEIDFFALSFARDRQHVLQLKAMLEERGSKARVVSKIENHQGIDNLEGIIEASGAVMIARGDLGVEMELEELPIIQRKIIERCSAYGRKVIVATEMLESMIKAPIPTRAEITDIFNAVNERVDCVMLSGETSIGKYPVRCVEVLDRVCRRIEEEYPEGRLVTVESEEMSDTQRTVDAATSLANSIDGAKLVVFSQRGKIGHLLAHARPERAPIFAFSPAKDAVQALIMARAVTPFQMEFKKTADATIEAALDILRKADLIKEGDPIVITSDVLQGEGNLDSILWRKA